MRRKTEEDNSISMDSLMDTVFNVVAILILVVIVGGMSSGSVRERIRKLRYTPPPGAAELDEPKKKLAEEIAALKEEIAIRSRKVRELAGIVGLEGKVKDMRSVIKELQTRLKDMKGKIATLRITTTEITIPSSHRKKVAFRPPFRHEISQTNAIYFWCDRGQLFTLDKNKVVKANNDVLLKFYLGKLSSGSVEKLIPSTNSTLFYSVTKRGSKTILRRSFGLNAKAKGETLAALKKNLRESKFTRIVSGENQKKTYFVFLVYKDGFNTFRFARDYVREKGFETNWVIYDQNERPSFGSGSSGTYGQ